VDHPHAKTLVVSMHDENLYGERALLAGARGYVMKHEPPSVLIAAVESVLQGRLAVSEALRERMLEARVGGLPSDDPVTTLSDRELEVFRRIGEGCGANEIADLLNLSIKTVNAYRDHIKRKLQIDSAAELRKYAVEWAMSNQSS
jgi:DNA-binding NarL/FixJ family response regulator